MPRKPPIRNPRGVTGDIAGSVPMRKLVKSASDIGITKDGPLLEYLNELDDLWATARHAEQENSEANCKKEIRAVACSAKMFLDALNKTSSKSKARMSWALRKTDIGINELIARASDAVLYIGPIDYEGAVPDWSMAPTYAHVGAELIRLYEKYQPGYDLHFGIKQTAMPDFQYTTPGAQWFAYTMKLLFPDIYFSRLTTAAEDAREMAGRTKRGK